MAKSKSKSAPKIAAQAQRMNDSLGTAQFLPREYKCPHANFGTPTRRRAKRAKEHAEVLARREHLGLTLFPKPYNPRYTYIPEELSRHAFEFHTRVDSSGRKTVKVPVRREVDVRLETKPYTCDAVRNLRAERGCGNPRRRKLDAVAA